MFSLLVAFLLMLMNAYSNLISWKWLSFPSVEMTWQYSKVYLHLKILMLEAGI